MDTVCLRNIDTLYQILRSIISIDNQRSFIYIANLVDAIVTCLDNPNAHNQTFLYRVFLAHSHHAEAFERFKQLIDQDRPLGQKLYS